MSGSASLGVEQAMLSHTLGIGPVAAVSRAYVALCLASLVPDEQVRGVEVSGNGYARLAASFQVLASPPNMAANTTTVAFPTATAPWGVLGYFELWDAPYGGNRLYWGALVDPADGMTPITLSVSAGDVLRFSAGALGVRIGPSGAGATGGAFLPLVGGTLASPGNLTVGGAFNVTGAAATLGGPLSVTGPTALAGGATITGESSIRSGNFTLAFDPTLPLHAATKQYVDGGGAGGGLGPFLPTTGGSLNGPGNLVVGGTLAVTGATTLNGGTFTGTFAGNPTLSGNVAVGGTLGVTGVLTASTSISTPIIGNGATITLALQPLKGPTTVGGRFQDTNFGSSFNIASNNTGSFASQWHAVGAVIDSVGTLSGNSYASTYTFSDQADTTGVIYGHSVALNVAPNGNTASGPRVASTVSLAMIGDSAGGSITGASISTALQANANVRSNLGGTATNYFGSVNGLNVVADLAAGTFLSGFSGFELDTQAQAGVSYDYANQLLIVTLGPHAVRGRINSNRGIVFSAGSNTTLADTMAGVQFGYDSSYWPMDAYSRLMFVSPSLSGDAAQIISTAIDTAHSTAKVAHRRVPFAKELPLQALAVTTGTKRLTTDGLAASSFVSEFLLTSGGTGFVANPTITPSNTLVGISLAAIVGNGGVAAKPGVPNPGTLVPQGVTVTITGGTGATGRLIVDGNTLNFAPNTAVGVSATIAAHSAAGEAVGYGINFGAVMGATPGTTAIIPAANITSSITATALAVTAISQGTVQVGGTVVGAGVSAGTTITAFNSGTIGSVGTYTVNNSQTVASESMTVSPAWTQLYASAGAGGKITLPGPWADTTLGAIDLEINVNSGTWDIGGFANMVKTVRL
jgi:hypothetical protein